MSFIRVCLCRGIFKGYLEYTLEGFGGGMCGGNGGEGQV